MGQGEQKTLYPFLGQGCSAPLTTAPTPSNVQVPPPEQNGAPRNDSQKPTKPKGKGTGPQRKRTKTNSISRLLNKNEASKDEVHYGGEAPPGPSSTQAQVTPLDEDPNPRRKRRRVSAGDLDWEPQPLTKNVAGCPLQLNPKPGSSPLRQQFEESPSRGSEPFSSQAHRPKTRHRKLLPKQNKDLSAIEQFPATQSEPTEGIQRETYQSFPVEEPNEIPQPNLLTPDSIKPVHSDTEVTGPDNGEPGQLRKTLKLNPNGKLLSSPTLNKPRSQSLGRKRGRRRKATKNRHSSASPVKIKYPAGEPGRERFGGLINDISNGLTRYPPLRALSPPAVCQKPSKPTHPFFLGKASDQADNPLESAQQVQCSAILISEDNITPNPTQFSQKSTPAVNIVQPNRASTKHRPATSGPIFSTKPRLSRGSNLMEALWPPRDFSHNSVAQGINNSQFAANAKFVNNAEKKGKTPLLGIPDSESILHPLSKLAREFVYPNSTVALSVTKNILRRPKRYVADGATLQSLVADELSFNSARQPQESSYRNRTLLPDKGCHPAIRRLASSIPTSWTAFDKGEFDVLPWTHKYAPGTAEDVLQPGPEVLLLRDWLRHLMVSAVDTGNSLKDGPKPKQSKPGRNKKRNKKRKLADELDGFIVSSEDETSQPDQLTDPDEDELSGGVTFMSKRSLQPNNLTPNLSKARGQMWNAVLLSGPSGCGKTASVYAAAKELDFEIFELNAGSRRSAKDVLERVGDMTRNHLVNKRNHQEPGPDPVPVPAEHESGKQTLMSNIFPTKPTQVKKSEMEKDNTKKTEPEEPKRQKAQKQSLILLEEVDVLFEEDKQFWSGVLSLINQSKRPIIMTCRDEGLLPFGDLSFHTILRYSCPPCSLAVDFMLLLAASEGHLLQRKAVSDLYVASNQDLRASITELNFWCQMALGSGKSGIDWMIGNFRRPENLSDRQRVISKNTYRSGMGWYSRDIACSQGDEVIRDTSLMTQCTEQWPMEIMDWQETMGSALGPQGFDKPDNVDTLPDRNRLEALESKSEFADMQSILDLLSRTESKETTNDILDTSLPAISDKQRSSYIEGYQLLEADRQVNFSHMASDICSTITVLMKNSSLTDPMDSEDVIIEGVLKNRAYQAPKNLTISHFLSAFEPIRENIESYYTPPGRQAPSFENGIAAISEDLAPYVRSIIAFDLRLERRLMELSGLLWQGHGKKMRKTRASRAALEGGSKECIRRERWFPCKLNPARVLDTGGKGWQDLLHTYRERAEAGMDEEKEGSSDNSSESSGNGAV